MNLIKKPQCSCWKRSLISFRSLSETVKPVQVKKVFAEFWKHPGAPTFDSKSFQCFSVVWKSQKNSKMMILFMSKLLLKRSMFNLCLIYLISINKQFFEWNWWKYSLIAFRSLSETVTPVQVKLFAEFWSPDSWLQVLSVFYTEFLLSGSPRKIQIYDFVYEQTTFQKSHTSFYLLLVVQELEDQQCKLDIVLRADA